MTKYREQQEERSKSINKIMISLNKVKQTKTMIWIGVFAICLGVFVLALGELWMIYLGV